MSHTEVMEGDPQGPELPRLGSYLPLVCVSALWRQSLRLCCLLCVRHPAQCSEGFRNTYGVTYLEVHPEERTFRKPVIFQLRKVLLAEEARRDTAVPLTVGRLVSGRRDQTCFLVHHKLLFM